MKELIPIASFVVNVEFDFSLTQITLESMYMLVKRES